MSTSVTTSFVKQYEREVHDVFQRTGSFLYQTVRQKPDVKGSTTTFQVIGTGVATTQGPSRHHHSNEPVPYGRGMHAQ